MRNYNGKISESRNRVTIPVQNRHTLDFESYKVFNPTGSSKDINFDYFKAKGTLNLDTIKSLDQ